MPSLCVRQRHRRFPPHCTLDMFTFMYDFTAAFRAAWIAASDSRRQRTEVARRHRRRDIAQAARLAAMSREELERASTRFGGRLCQLGLKRRGF